MKARKKYAPKKERKKTARPPLERERKQRNKKPVRRKGKQNTGARILRKIEQYLSPDDAVKIKDKSRILSSVSTLLVYMLAALLFRDAARTSTDVQTALLLVFLIMMVCSLWSLSGISRRRTYPKCALVLAIVHPVVLGLSFLLLKSAI